MPTPYRTGITTIFKYLRAICKLIVAFREVISEIWTPEQMAVLDELADLCEQLLAFPNPRP